MWAVSSRRCEIGCGDEIVFRYGDLAAVLVVRSPDDLDCGENGDGEEDSDDAADFRACEDSEQDGEWMKLEFATHDSRGRDVVLNAAPDEKKDE